MLDFGEPLFELYRSHDVFVLPSLSEGTPRTLVEARAFGCPAVATPRRRNSFIGADGQNGLLVEPMIRAVWRRQSSGCWTMSRYGCGLIDAGLQDAPQQSVEYFVDQLVEEINILAQGTARAPMSGSVQSKAKRGIVVTPYTLDLVDAVKAFNARLRAGGAALTFPENPVPEWLPPVEGREIFHEYYVAVDDDAVRGAYILKHQPFWVGGQRVRMSQFRLPLSEGQIDKRYAAVGVQLYLDAVRKQKLLYTMGIGGYQEAFAGLLLSAGWKTWVVPFYFRVFHPRQFLRISSTCAPRRCAGGP